MSKSIEYKGYYIDKVIFNNEKEIDDFIKKETIRKYQNLCRMFAEEPSLELVEIMEPYELKLYDLGFSWEEIEELGYKEAV